MERTPNFLVRIRERRSRQSKGNKAAASFANFLEQSSAVRIWVRLNQSLAIAAIALAALGLWGAITKREFDTQRAEQDRVAKAWSVVDRMRGTQSNGGQVEALERLVSAHVSLSHIDLHDTFLAGARLHGADLSGANLEGANFVGADLGGAFLNSTNLRGAYLMAANLGGAYFDDADLRDAKLVFASVDMSIVMAARLDNTDLTGAILVSEDPEDGGDTWFTFPSGFEEQRTPKEWQALIDTACANPKFALPQREPTFIVLPKRRCPKELEYFSIGQGWIRGLAKYATEADWDRAGHPMPQARWHLEVQYR